MKPLSEHAIAELKDIAAKPVPCLSVNPGCLHKLCTMGLARIVSLPSPFKTHRGRNIEHIEATDSGREYLKGVL